MYKQAFISFYYLNKGVGKVFEILSTSGVDFGTDLQLEKEESEIVQLIINEYVKSKMKKLPKSYFHVQMRADFTKTKIKNVENFEIMELKNFKLDDKNFKIQLRKEQEKDEPVSAK